MRPSTYQQCRLRRQHSEQVCFLPQKYAIAGRVVRLKQFDGSWQDGWAVADVYGEPVPEHLLPDAHDAVKVHRKATGDAATRPKN